MGLGPAYDMGMKFTHVGCIGLDFKNLWINPLIYTTEWLVLTTGLNVDIII